MQKKNITYITILLLLITVLSNYPPLNVFSQDHSINNDSTNVQIISNKAKISNTNINTDVRLGRFKNEIKTTKKISELKNTIEIQAIQIKQLESEINKYRAMLGISIDLEHEYKNEILKNGRFKSN